MSPKSNLPRSCGITVKLDIRQVTMYKMGSYLEALLCSLMFLLRLACIVCSTGRVQLGPASEFGLLATPEVGFLLPQVGSRLIGEPPITRQGSYLLGIFLSFPLLPRSTHWPYWTYSHSLFLVCCHQPRLPSICHGLFLPVTDHFPLSRIFGTTCILFATL